MRYIIETKDEQGLIGIQIDKWKKEKKLDLIEKAEPVIEIKNKLEKVSRALNNLKNAGWDEEVMLIFISKKTGLGMGNIKNIMNAQDNFFRSIGVKI